VTGEAIDEFLRVHGVREILHFTTNVGLVGILGDEKLLARSELPAERHLVNVYRTNAKVRYDKVWVDHVNLSLSRINAKFFGASRAWHHNRDVWWCVLAFDPVIASHPEVKFATTNNRYSGCRRRSGIEGLRALWAPKVHQYEGMWAERTPQHQRAWPTCRQAEVLYPIAVSTEFLRCVYVVSEMHGDIAETNVDVLGHAPIPVEVRPDVFR
jgi:hypothetical protein